MDTIERRLESPPAARDQLRAELAQIRHAMDTSQAMAEGYMLGVKAGIEGYDKHLAGQGLIRQDPPKLVDVQTIERDERGDVIQITEHKAFANFTTAAECACGGTCGCHR